MKRCPRCGGGPGDPSCGKTIHDSLEDLEDDVKTKYVVRERPVGGVEYSDLGWLMPVTRYDRGMRPYSQDKKDAEVFDDREKAQARADHHRGEVVEL